MRSAAQVVLALATLSLMVKPNNAQAEEQNSSPLTQQSSQGSESVAQGQVELLRAPISQWALEGPQVRRVAISLAGGWPHALLEIDYGATDLLGFGFRVGYLYGSLHSGIRTAQGVLVELPLRLRVFERGRIQISLEVIAGVGIGLDRYLSGLAENLVGSEVFPISTEIAVGFFGTFALSDRLGVKFGFSIPSTVMLTMVERPHVDAWELSLPLAFRAGVVYQLFDWMSFFAVVDIGPDLMVEPNQWLSEGYEYGFDVEIYLRGSAGITFSPWR